MGSGKASVRDASTTASAAPLTGTTFPLGAVLADSGKALPLLAAGSMPRVRARARVMG